MATHLVKKMFGKMSTKNNPKIVQKRFSKLVEKMPRKLSGHF
jgi:hypothetical protein